MLANGKVLVTGGYNGNILSSAELFDPTTGIWTPIGSLNNARDGHTATLLPNGQVLVAGGYNGSNYLNSVELFDPASETWTTTNSLNNARDGHTATLLPNGQVLVAGGTTNYMVSASTVLASAEIYNPANGTWTPTGSLNGARVWHTATLLPNGQVLVAGGTTNLNSSSASYLSSTEIYNPINGTWTVTNALNTAREDHTATLLPNGKVLIAGGLVLLPFFPVRKFMTRPSIQPPGRGRTPGR